MTAAPTNSRSRPSFVAALAIFLGSFFLLQYAWGTAAGTRLERWVIDDATVGTSVVLINGLTPAAMAVASGTRIAAAGGGINVNRGCEGTEVWFLLAAALLAYPFAWRIRAMGCGIGLAYVFVINQLRLLALFYSARDDRALFNPLHGFVAPLALVALTLLLFVALQRWDRRLKNPRRGLGDASA